MLDFLWPTNLFRFVIANMKEEIAIINLSSFFQLKNFSIKEKYSALRFP